MCSLCPLKDTEENREDLGQFIEHVAALILWLKMMLIVTGVFKD